MPWAQPLVPPQPPPRKAWGLSHDDPSGSILAVSLTHLVFRSQQTKAEQICPPGRTGYSCNSPSP